MIQTVLVKDHLTGVVAPHKLGRIRPTNIIDLPRFRVRILKFPDGTVKVVTALAPHYHADQDNIPPANTHWATKAAAAISQMYGNVL